jgi:hypothetical protein
MSNIFARLVGLPALLAVIVTQASVAHAGTLGGVQGVITDSKTGAPVAGVRLQISSPSQSITTTTDAHGHYVALSLPPDDYTLTAQKEGYITESLGGYSIFADQTQVYDLKLAPGTDASE